MPPNQQHRRGGKIKLKIARSSALPAKFGRYFFGVVGQRVGGAASPDTGNVFTLRNVRAFKRSLEQNFPKSGNFFPILEIFGGAIKASWTACFRWLRQRRQPQKVTKTDLAVP